MAVDGAGTVGTGRGRGGLSTLKGRACTAAGGGRGTPALPLARRLVLVGDSDCAECVVVWIHSACHASWLGG